MSSSFVSVYGYTRPQYFRRFSLIFLSILNPLTTYLSSIFVSPLPPPIKTVTFSLYFKSSSYTSIHPRYWHSIPPPTTVIDETTLILLFMVFVKLQTDKVSNLITLHVTYGRLSCRYQTWEDRRLLNDRRVWKTVRFNDVGLSTHPFRHHRLIQER